MKTRIAVVNLVNSWLGKKESDGSFKEIIDIYNSLPVDKLPRRTKMSYSWEWCACTWSALAIKLGYTDIMPIEISCSKLIMLAKEKGIWIEKDDRVPLLGEAVLYDWDDTRNYAIVDNTGDPEHIGTVVEVNEKAGYFVVTEGNYNEAVKKRTLSINGRYIRGFISPKYDDGGVIVKPAETGKKSITTIAREVIAGSWGNNPTRKLLLIDAGYDAQAVQAEVNRILNGNAIKPPIVSNTTKKEFTSSVTAVDYAACGPNDNVAGEYVVSAVGGLYMRHGAGTNKKAIVCIPNGTKVKCYGYYSIFNGAKWLYIQVIMNGVKYTGFSHSGYLVKK